MKPILFGLLVLTALGCSKPETVESYTGTYTIVANRTITYQAIANPINSRESATLRTTPAGSAGRLVFTAGQWVLTARLTGNQFEFEPTYDSIDPTIVTTGSGSFSGSRINYRVTT